MTTRYHKHAMVALASAILTIPGLLSAADNAGKNQLILEPHLYSGRRNPPEQLLDNPTTLKKVEKALLNLPKAPVDFPPPYLPGFRIKAGAFDEPRTDVWIGLGFVAFKKDGAMHYLQDVNNIARILSEGMPSKTTEFAKALRKHAAVMELTDKPKDLATVDVSAELRWLALTACANQGRTDVLPAARILAQTGETVVIRRIALGVIKKLGTESDVGLLESLAEDTDKGVARSAKSAVKTLRERIGKNKDSE